VGNVAPIFVLVLRASAGCFVFLSSCFLVFQYFTMVTMGGDLQPGSLADRLLTGLGQPQINP